MMDREMVEKYIAWEVKKGKKLVSVAQSPRWSCLIIRGRNLA